MKSELVLDVLRRLFGAALVLCGLSSSALAQPTLVPVGQLQGTSSGADSFGASVASYRETTAPGREWLFVGAPTELSARGKQDGAVYVFVRDSNTNKYVLFQKIEAIQISQGNDGDRLGAGVYAKRGWLFVAVPNYSNYNDVPLWFPLDRPATDSNPEFWFSGRILVFRFENGTWTWQQTLSANWPKREGQFGAQSFSRHIALSDDADILVIGEPDTYAATSPERLGISRLQVLRTWSPTNQKWCCQQVIDVAQDTPTTDFLAADSVVALPGKRFAIDVHVRELEAPHSTNATWSRGEIWVYKPGGQQFGDILSRIPVQKILGKKVLAGDCTGQNEQPGSLSHAGFDGMAAGGGYFAAAQPCAEGTAGQRAGRVDVYKVQLNEPPLQLETSFEGWAAEMMFGSSLAGGQESISIDSKGCRILVGSAVQGSDVRFFYRGNQGWQLVAQLLPGSLQRKSFGQAVTFPYFPTRAVVGKVRGVSPTDKGTLLIYQVPRC